MRIAHSFLAILAGFITVIGVTGIATLLLKKLAGEETPRDPLHMAAQLATTLIGAVLGGYVTARYSQANPLAHMLMLALVVLFMGGLSALQMKGRQPAYYSIAVTAIPPLGTLVGGLFRLHQIGIHW
ncbi:MAG TPA: hypothetical protein VHB45_03785 [Alloacidobacterium sp.]|nr:hypothetical protein [Alloacidobacterium sp.]